MIHLPRWVSEVWSQSLSLVIDAWGPFGHAVAAAAVLDSVGAEVVEAQPHVQAQAYAAGAPAPPAAGLWGCHPGAVTTWVGCTTVLC